MSASRSTHSDSYTQIHCIHTIIVVNVGLRVLLSDTWCPCLITVCHKFHTFWTIYVFGSCFRMLAVILVSDFLFFTCLCFFADGFDCASTCWRWWPALWSHWRSVCLWEPWWLPHYIISSASIPLCFSAPTWLCGSSLTTYSSETFRWDGLVEQFCLRGGIQWWF